VDVDTWEIVKSPMQLRWERPLLVVATLLIFSGFVRAQPSQSASARELNEQARRSYNLGHWRDAIDAFEKAYQLTGDPALLFNLAQSHRHLGNGEEALRFYRAYLREKTDPTNRQIAEEQIKELEVQNWHDPFVATPSKTSPISPPQNSPHDVAPTPLPVAADITSTPHILPPPLAPATPIVTGVAPAPTSAAIATTAPPPSEPPPRVPVPRWLAWAGGAVTVVLGVSAIATGLSASSRFDNLKNSCGQTSAGCSSDQISGVKSRDHAATILWVLAAATAVSTGIVVYVDTREAGFSTLWRF